MEPPWTPWTVKGLTNKQDEWPNRRGLDFGAIAEEFREDDKEKAVLVFTRELKSLSPPRLPVVSTLEPRAPPGQACALPPSWREGVSRSDCRPNTPDEPRPLDSGGPLEVD